MDLILNRMAKRSILPSQEEALPDNAEEIFVSNQHAVLATPLKPPFPEYTESVYLGLGCFWGAERKFWQLEGVYTTAVGYMGGFTANATYEQVCTGKTGHNEVVLVAYNPEELSFERLLETFWTAHDPTQGMRQGNDVGTQYRSGIYVTQSFQELVARDSLKRYQQSLASEGYGEVTTEILAAPPFYYAENYHQQYLFKNPNGYCGLGGTGVPMCSPEN